MAKFNIEVEIDWLDEEGNIDEIIKTEIQHGIVNKISKQISDEVKIEQQQRFKDQIESRVNELVNDTFEALISLNVVQTDEYGEAKRTFPSVREMIKAKFDTYLTEQVDAKNGGKCDRYSTGVSRFEYIMGKSFGNELEKKMAELKKETEKKTTDAMAAMFKAMQETLEASVKGELGAKVAELIKLDEILKLGNGKS